MTDAELAAKLAQGAGAILLQVRESGIYSGQALGDIGDQLAHRFIASALAEHRPSDGLLSEESADSPDRLAKERVWIVDPLDGTREYSEGREDWAVHVALAINGKAEVGSVALPARGLLLRSDGGKHPPKSAENRLRMVVSRTRRPAETATVAQLLDAKIIPMGSCGAKAMAVLLGEADIYLHSGGQFEWDNCAPVAVAQAHGLHCSRLEGAPLIYNQRETYLSDLLICRKELAEPVLGIMILAT
jgi:3'(2'), 5'-bisphosphate nucleotidase